MTYKQDLESQQLKLVFPMISLIPYPILYKFYQIFPCEVILTKTTEN